MSDQYDQNGYATSDFKRNPISEDQHDHDQEGQGDKINEKADEYIRELLSEKIKLNNAKFPIITKLLDQEVSKVQSTGRIPYKDHKYVDVYREKPVKVTVKVLVPVKEHPKFNFIGKILGPKGNTMKLLQEETMCKMAVLGRGSMRDKQKEEELRNSLDPKYAHLSDELHVEVSALAPPAEAHARIAYALAEVKKYLIPDTTDMLRQTQMRDFMERGPHPGPHAAPRPGPGRMAPRLRAPVPPPLSSRPPAKTKVISILDRARSAMDTSYPYEDHYGAHEAPVRVAREPELYYERAHEHAHAHYYEDEYKEYKARDVGSRRPTARTYARASPYGRPPK